MDRAINELMKKLITKNPEFMSAKVKNIKNVEVKTYTPQLFK